MTKPLTFIYIFLVFCFEGCFDGKQRIDSEINFKDTLYRSRILTINDGDTIWQHDTIYYSRTNTRVDTSNFFYKACKQPCLDQEVYRIYFQREKVILFCDSTLAA